MKPQAHLYKIGAKGRSLTARHSCGTTVTEAHVACQTCKTVGTVSGANNLPPEVFDKKFRQAGWKLDPHVCPNCIAKAAQLKKDAATMTAQPDLKAQALVHETLSERFNKETGRYADGWSDARIVKECSMSADFVARYRTAAFGPLKEPEESARLRADLVSFKGLVAQQFAEFESRFADLARKFAG